MTIRNCFLVKNKIQSPLKSHSVLNLASEQESVSSSIVSKLYTEVDLLNYYLKVYNQHGVRYYNSFYTRRICNIVGVSMYG